MIKFNDSYKCDIPILDREHEQIINALNNVLAEHNVKGNMNKMARIFFSYLTDHFMHEEGIMFHINYPEIEAHKVAHYNLKDIYIRMLKRIQDKNCSLTEGISILDECIIEHLEHFDKPFIKWLKDNPTIPAVLD